MHCVKRKNMDKKNPFCSWKCILIYFVYFHNVSSSDAVEDVKKRDKLIDKIKYCDTVNVIGDSSYVQSCSILDYPKEEDLYLEDTNIALCMLVYDTTSKICEYSSKQSPKNSGRALLPSSVKELDTEIGKFEYFNNNTETCKNISLIFNILKHLNVEGFKDLTPYLEYSQTLLTNSKCTRTCSSPVSEKINHLCSYLLWASDFFTTLKRINTDNDQESLPTKDAKSNAKTSVPEETHEEENKKPSHISDNVEKDDKNPKKTVSETENQQNKQVVLPPSNNKKSDDTPKHQINIADTSNNEPNNKPKDEKQLEKPNDSHVPAPPKEDDVADIVESKKNEGVDNFHQLVPDDVNQDTDSFSAEDHQNKKGIDEHEEENDRDNVDTDQKESNNQGPVMPIKLPEEDNEPDQRQKFLPQPDSKAEEESHFFTYFSIFSLLCIVLYFGYHNKQKIFAILLEGRRSRRGRGSRRRPSTASYRKLDCNLEEAVTSQCNSNVTHVIY